jgi:hypothetical protein
MAARANQVRMSTRIGEGQKLVIPVFAQDIGGLNEEGLLRGCRRRAGHRFDQAVTAKISRIRFLKLVILDRFKVGARAPPGARCLMVDGGYDRRDPPLAIDIFGHNFDGVVGRVAKFRHRDRLWMTGIGRDDADKER